MIIPLHNDIDTKVLDHIYDNTVATYKYYWFIAMLDIVVKQQRRQISFGEIIAGMIAEAWDPINYFHLSFGKSDSMCMQMIELRKELNIPIDASKMEIKDTLIKHLNKPKITKILGVFSLNVPYRFLSPWIPYTTDKEVTLLSQLFANDCIYSIADDTIELNPLWEAYLNDNYIMLRDYTFWHLTKFLQKRNPNVPNVSSKLNQPKLRNTLTKQRQFWDTFIELNGPISCVYTGKLLDKKKYDINHFIPWSYVSHNLLWNLLPSDSSTNLLRSNDLPSLEKYLHPYAQVHLQAIQAIYPKNPNNKMLEDYLTLHHSLSDLINFSENDFFNLFQKTFAPMVQIAENMGFKHWKELP